MTVREELAILRSEIVVLRTEVADLRRFQSWILGGLGMLGIVGALLADKFKKTFGLV